MLPHQTSQTTQPIAVTESAKQVAEVANPPKVDIATDLFDMLSMDSPNDNGASSASVDDNSWTAFQCMLSYSFVRTVLSLSLLYLYLGRGHGQSQQRQKI